MRQPHLQATEPQIRTIYEGFGLTSRQIEIVATAQPKRDYYYQSRAGNRLFDLDLARSARHQSPAERRRSTGLRLGRLGRGIKSHDKPGFVGFYHCARVLF